MTKRERLAYGSQAIANEAQMLLSEGMDVHQVVACLLGSAAAIAANHGMSAQRFSDMVGQLLENTVAEKGEDAA